MNQPDRPFLETLYHLRTVEHIILYNKLAAVPYREEQDVVAFLEGEYEREVTDYPFTAPAFSPDAGLWGAKTVYFAAQLFLYRDNKATELKSILPPYKGIIDASAILSADLCLRFLPSVKYALENVDADDPLIAILNGYLRIFPYSAIGTGEELPAPATASILEDNCLRQLYLDRITERKAAKWAEEYIIKNALLANMGDYKNDFWREFQ